MTTKTMGIVVPGLFLEAFVNKSIPSGESTKDLIGYVAQQDLFGQVRVDRSASLSH